MIVLKDGKPYSNSVFWDANTQSCFMRFVNWKTILSCKAIGHAERTIYIHVDNQRLDFKYVDEETMFRNLDRLMEEVSSLAGTDGTLAEKVEKMYYAPGMPGFEETQAQFYNRQSMRENELHDEIQELQGG